MLLTEQVVKRTEIFEVGTITYMKSAESNPTIVDFSSVLQLS